MTLQSTDSNRRGSRRGSAASSGRNTRRRGGAGRTMRKGKKQKPPEVLGSFFLGMLRMGPSETACFPEFYLLCFQANTNPVAVCPVRCILQRRFWCGASWLAEMFLTKSAGLFPCVKEKYTYAHVSPCPKSSTVRLVVKGFQSLV